MNPDPIRPPETDEEPWTVPPLVPDRPSAVIGFLLAGASGFIVGILVAWAVSMKRPEDGGIACPVCDHSERMHVRGASERYRGCMVRFEGAVRVDCKCSLGPDEIRSDAAATEGAVR